MEHCGTVMGYEVDYTYTITNDLSILRKGGWVMVFNATFNNISAISWRLVLFVEQIWVPRENHRFAASS